MPAQQALDLALSAAPYVPKRLYTSDQPRCAELAAGLARVWRLPLEVDSNLREISFGLWEGSTYAELEAEDHARWRAWCDNWQELAPPEGESLPTFERRIRAWLKTQKPCDGTLVVTHAGVMRAMDVIAGESWSTVMSREYPYLGWRAYRLEHEEG